ncbi:MAG TPA: NYN domain-containing protein, partial [Aggregatilineales bacterium]|nr:NYN domain-containing protein [Aggregatilineales bacterium]
MSTQQYSERHLAMLIDGDNAQHKFIKEILEEVSRYGTTTYRRAYGDWTQPNLAGWRDVMQESAIDPIHKWRSVNGKNATDIDLTINAMEILYTGKVQGFCIVSSDSDFTGLCMKIRDAGLFVMGIGEKKTPKPFVNACDVFLYVEDIIQPKKPPQQQTPTIPSIATKKPKDAIDILRHAFDISA